MRRPYRTIGDVLRSPWAGLIPKEETPPQQNDRVLHSTKLEDRIYADLRNGDPAMDALEQAAGEKLRSFPALARDTYQSFYSLLPHRIEDGKLSAAARKFNGPILENMLQSEDYPTLKSICEGRELPAYEAAAEFAARVGGELDQLLAGLGGEKGAVNTLERLEAAQEKAQEELAALLERMRKSGGQNDVLEQAIIAAANTAESKQRQVEAVNGMIDVSAARNKDVVSTLVASATAQAAEKAEEVRSIIAAWGNEPGDLKRTEANTKILDLVRQSDVLKNVAKYLGRFREIFAQGKRNGYAYGRGETYSLELGSNLSRAITSELSMLASPATLPLFLQKYQRKQIKQYQRREPIYKGAGDIICCLDESGSTEGDLAAWGKAVALTLLEIAEDGGRKFALIHFSDASSLKGDLFLPGGLGQGKYSPESKMEAAQTFLGGGTNFDTPMWQAVSLIERQGFEHADIVFITDGECCISEKFLEKLRTAQAEHRFTITGILLDQGEPGMKFSLQEFCQNIYRTSDLLGDDIVRKLVAARV